MAGGRHNRENVCILRPNCSDAPFVALSLAGNQRHSGLTTTDCRQSRNPRELESLHAICVQEWGAVLPMVQQLTASLSVQPLVSSG